MSLRKKAADSERPPLERVAAILPTSLLAEVDRFRAGLRAKGQRVSFSGIVEVALHELVGRRDASDILRRRGARARRGSG